MHIVTAADGTIAHRSGPIWLDWICAALGIVLLSNALLFLLVGVEEDTLDVVLAGSHADDYRLKQAIFGAVYVMAGILLLSRDAGRRWTLYGWPLVILMAVPALSALWSPDPGLTLRRSLSLWGTTLFGIYLAVTFTEAQLRRLVIFSALLGALASVVAVAVMFDKATMEYGEAGRVLRGAYSHKNILALHMALGLLCLAAPRPDRRQTPLGLGARIALGAILAALLLGANSATSVLVLLGAITVGWTLPPDGMTSKRWFLAGAACFALAGLAPFILAADKALVLDIVGRDGSLTNRVPLWHFVTDRIADNPLLGWGFGTFFSGLDAPAVEHWSVSGLMEIHSHNGYLQLSLDAGLVGLAAFAAVLLPYVKRLEQLREWRWHVMLLVFVLAYNITEVGLVSPHSIVWALFMASRTRAILTA